MTETQATVSLFKTIVGGGILALPAGMAAGRGTGVLPGLLILALHAGASAYTYSLVGRSVAKTRSKTFSELWSAAFGRETSWIIDLIIVGVAGGAALTYSCALCGVHAVAQTRLTTRPRRFHGRPPQAALGHRAHAGHRAADAVPHRAPGPPARPLRAQAFYHSWFDGRGRLGARHRVAESGRELRRGRRVRGGGVRRPRRGRGARAGAEEVTLIY